MLSVVNNNKQCNQNKRLSPWWQWIFGDVSFVVLMRLYEGGGSQNQCVIFHVIYHFYTTFQLQVASMLLSLSSSPCRVTFYVFSTSLLLTQVMGSLLIGTIVSKMRNPSTSSTSLWPYQLWKPVWCFSQLTSY